MTRHSHPKRPNRPAAAILAFLATAAAAEPAGPRSAAIHPETRRQPSPADGATVAVNPPPLLWAPRTSRDVRYDVRLSRDPNFPRGSTRAASDLPWAMYNPHARLAPGEWHWQVGTRRPGRAPQWSKVLRFRVTPSAREAVTPPAAKVLAACPKGHPRLLATRDELRALRRRLRDAPEPAHVRGRAKRYLTRKPPEEAAARPSQTGADPLQSKRFAQWASKGYGRRFLDAADWLTSAYLLTGEERYGRAAVRWGLAAAALDPDGATSPRVSDFADGACTRAMALVYDSCFDLLTEAQRRQLRDAMAVRARRFFGRAINRLEAKVFSAHIWQHILAEYADAAWAMLGELPEAQRWAAYVYELWVARFPCLGGDDGGWANGVNYFTTNIESLLVLPALHRRLGGVDLRDHPWYRAAGHSLMYAWPAGGIPDGFGDGCDRRGAPPRTVGYLAECLALRFGDPHVLWYARQVLGKDGSPAGLSARLLWHRLHRPAPATRPRPASPGDLPQARAFRDIGVVSMHTALAETARDLVIGFRASPYGATNHMHACQNSFNLHFGGRRLFANSGYYIAYGDPHFRGWYKHTRGHNSVLIDGKGQVFGAAGCGWIARYLHGRQISYCLGDASRAYGDAGLTTFRRHLALLRPSTVVIYDELAADHPAAWSWLLHGDEEIRPDAERGRLLGTSRAARAQVDVRGSAPLELRVTSRFDPPAVNWRKRKSGGELIQYADQWHATVTPGRPLARARFLAIVQVRGKGDAAPFHEPRAEPDGRLRLGDWHVAAELDPARDASLVIVRRDGRAALAADVPRLTVAGRQHRLPEGASLLVEADAAVARTARDKLPPGAR